MHTEYAEDKELIELAAKAAGITLVSKLMPNPDGTETLEFFQLFDNGRIGTWNPMKDDGDAFRLSVKLHMKIYTGEAYPWDSEVADYSMRFSGVCDEDEEPDPYAATRKAITRAAAEIRRNIK